MKTHPFELKGKTIFVAGHTGLVGSALVRKLSERRDGQILTASRTELDLTYPSQVRKFLRKHKPDIVILAAGRVGGIVANKSFPAEFIHENLMIEANVIDSAWRAGVPRLLNFGAACMYPRECLQPMKTESLMTGKVEPTSEPYAVAKLSGMVLCNAYRQQYGVSYITVIPSNLYGPGENFDLETAHVVAALIRRFHEAKEKEDSQINLWGTGKAKRDFLFIEDLVSAVMLLLGDYDDAAPINIGSEKLCSISELAKEISKVVGFRGAIKWDHSRPDGADAKSLDSTRLKSLGWAPKISLSDGLKKTYEWFCTHK
jgi:GDP-L-fucose synthase